MVCTNLVCEGVREETNVDQHEQKKGLEAKFQDSTNTYEEGRLDCPHRLLGAGGYVQRFDKIHVRTITEPKGKEAEEPRGWLSHDFETGLVPKTIVDSFSENRYDREEC